MEDLRLMFVAYVSLQTWFKYQKVKASERMRGIQVEFTLTASILNGPFIFNF